jgi:hypothetical protein
VIKEYRIDPRNTWDVAMDRFRYEWNDSCSINLRFVTFAQRHGDGTYTYIRLAGHPTGMVIDAQYDIFMRDWQSVQP